LRSPSTLLRFTLCTAMILGLSCGPPRGRPSIDSAESQDQATELADSLAVRTPQGIEVWFTDSRVGIGADGAPCIERVMEIRREGDRTPVPLLYTGEAPVVLNDSTVRTHIWLNCRPGNTYDVNLRTGEPRRVE